VICVVVLVLYIIIKCIILVFSEYIINSIYGIHIQGEDPVLGSIMVKPLIAGMQENVMAIAKHYILNNQVRLRMDRSNTAGWVVLSKYRQ
jgi:hypothetical protein